MLNQNVRPKSGPSPVLYVVAGVIIIGCLVAGGVQCAKAFESYDEWLTYVTVPGAETITLSEAGKYTIYHEHTTVLDGQPYSPTDAQPGELEYTLKNTAGGEQVSLSSPSMNETYELGPRQGVAIMVFTIDEPGEYEFAAKYRDGRTEPKLVLAVGQGIVGRIFTAFLVPALIGGAGFLIGIVIIIVTAVGQSRAKRAALMAQQQMMPPPGQFPGPGR